MCILEKGGFSYLEFCVKHRLPLRLQAHSPFPRGTAEAVTMAASLSPGRKDNLEESRLRDVKSQVQGEAGDQNPYSRKFTYFTCNFR